MTRMLCSVLVASAGLAVALTGTTRADGFSAESMAGQQPVDEIALTLSNPGAHPRLGLPDFVLPAGVAPEMATIAKTVADVLWDDLNFEREYYLVPRTGSATIPITPVASIPYGVWAAIGADFVLHGNAYPSGENLVVELRLLSVRGQTPGTQHFGKRYQCGVETERGPRDCAHQIADDFHLEVRQVQGVARTKIAFTSDRDSARITGRPSQVSAIGKEIYIADYDGHNQVRLTANRSINISPSWSPTGGLLAYTSYASGFPDVYVANLAQPGRGLQRPAGGSESVHNQLSAWSPDGSMLAFMSNKSGNQDIWVVNRDGSGLRNITNYANGDEGSPTWSPDGQRLAFTSDRAGMPQLYVINLIGTGAQRVTSERIDRPTWSSQNFIAFTLGSPGSEIAIWDFNAPNAGVRVLTNGPGTSESPAISPNGRHIAFFTTRWGRQEIAVMDRTGSNVRRLTTVGNNTYPNWQPIPGR